MSAADVDIDESVLSSLDFDVQEVCDWQTDGAGDKACGQAADFLARHKCCGYSWFICAGHREMWERHGAGAMAALGPATCRCGFVHTTPETLLDFIPIGGKS